MISLEREEPLTVVLPESMLASLRRMVEDGDAVSPSEVIRHALEYYLRRFDPLADEGAEGWLKRFSAEFDDPVQSIALAYGGAHAEPAPICDEL